MAPSPTQTALHEAGHAIALMSCNLDEIVLICIKISDHQGSYGRNCIELRGAASTTGGVHYFSDAPAANAAMALIAVSGLVAERIFGFETMISQDDQRLMFIHLLALLGSGDESLDIANFIHGPTGTKEQFSVKSQMLNEYAAQRCGHDIHSAFSQLFEEAERRLSDSKLALERLRDELLIRPEIEAPRVREIVEVAGWCGFRGPPRISGFFPAIGR